MKTPQDFGGPTGVLNTGMVIVACLYTAVGFFGYLKYGENVAASITLNLDGTAVLAQSVRLMMALAIFLSYGLQFYVPISIMGPAFRNLFTGEFARGISDVALRITLVIFTCKSPQDLISYGCQAYGGVLQNNNILYLYVKFIRAHSKRDPKSVDSIVNFLNEVTSSQSHFELLEIQVRIIVLYWNKPKFIHCLGRHFEFEL